MLRSETRAEVKVISSLILFFFTLNMSTGVKKDGKDVGKSMERDREEKRDRQREKEESKREKQQT